MNAIQNMIESLEKRKKELEAKELKHMEAAAKAAVLREIAELGNTLQVLKRKKKK